MSGDFAKVKAAASILDVIGKYLHVERQGSGYVCLCPFHEDHRPSMNIAPHRGAGVWKCWACGAGGDVIDFVEAYERISRRDALSVVADLAGVELSGDEPRSVWISPGCAHGFQTLSDDVTLLYLHGEHYAPARERRIHPLDPAIRIAWPLEVESMSEADSSTPFLAANSIGKMP
jgi:DNA primase